MADNTTINEMSGGDVIATDDIGGVKFQRIKVGFGVDGSYGDAARTNPLPVDQAPAGAVSTSSVAASVTSVSLKAANSNRKGLIVRNDSSATLYLAHDASATTSSPIEIPPGETLFDIPASTTLAVHGIWSSATGSARIEELS